MMAVLPLVTKGNVADHVHTAKSIFYISRKNKQNSTDHGKVRRRHHVVTHHSAPTVANK